MTEASAHIPMQANEDEFRSLERYFWAKVTTSPGCWEWRGMRTDRGYGLFNARRFGTVRAHRAVWKLVFGIDPGELYVLHRCDNPSCVRPSHLFLGTAMDNMNDKIAKGRARYRGGPYTQCKHGHPLTPDNLYRRPSTPTWRGECRICKRIGQAASLARCSASNATEKP